MLKNTITVIASVTIGCIGSATANPSKLEEVIVTAQKREESLQAIPLAVTAVDAKQLDALGISNLNQLGAGFIPTFRSHSFGNSSAIQVMTIRGNTPVDVAPVTRETSVAVYYDGIYYGRAQGLSSEIIDPERIEVLRGPQGTLFGRNATGGAVSIVSKKPTGQLDIEQTLGLGSYDERKSITRVDLPDVSGIKAKLDYVYHDRDGWVKNSAPGELDYGAYQKRGGRFALEDAINDSLRVDYAFDYANSKTTMPYFQMYRDFGGAIGDEGDRKTHTRMPVSPLDWSRNLQRGHALTVTWDLSPDITLKSLTGYRRLDDDNRGNFNGVLYFDGFIPWIAVKQSQFSQEFQAIGKADRLDWVAGAYFFREDSRQEFRNYFSLDEFGIVTGTPMTPIPVTNIDPLTGLPSPATIVHADSRSQAFYGQATWTPALAEDRIKLTAGGRYTRDHKTGDRNSTSDFDIATDRFDPLVSASYAWSPAMMSYVKWSTAYRSGGTNPLSVSFGEFKPEKVKTWEVGNKAEFWDQRARVNIALFHSDYEHMQMDFIDPNGPIVVQETINAERKASVEGAELELTVTPIERLVLGINYAYLDGDMPPQPNPFMGGALQKFETTSTPRHSGSATIDYAFLATSWGRWAAHIDATSTSDYAYVAFNNLRRDSSTVLNARIALNDIPIGIGKLALSVWGKNLTNEESIDFAFAVGTPPISVVQAFNEPRTFGADAIMKF